MSKIKILHIIKSLGRGGAEMLLQETLKEHNHEQFEFHFIYFLPWKNQMVAGIEAEQGKVTLMPANNNLRIMMKVPEIIRYVKQHKIDLIHAHLPWAGFASRLIFKLSKVPVIYSEHNIQDRYHILTKTINRLTFNWQTRVIAVSGDVAKSIAQRIHPKVPVEIILNGVNTQQFVRNEMERKEKRAALGVGDDDILIGNIAVFRFQKRLKEWITAIKKIQAKHPNVKAVLIGDGILKAEIMEHLKAAGMEEKIIFPGLQTDVLPWMSAMDIFMMTSSFEGLPIALLEAMSMECAIVTTDAGGIKELVRDGKDGFMKPVNEWMDLKEPLGKLISQPELLKEFGAKARMRVISSFSINVMVDQIENIYLDMIQQKK
jgi:glycosyltransferase involved in cell wall biosynthesis